jgi:deazaflavin-dependent oxidoreductase (nitroreductase family)
MPLDGTYEPTPTDWVREQVDAYERSGGREANTLRDTGIPIIVMTTRGNKTGAVRKSPLMRVEHEGEYALIGSKGGSPTNPVWVHNLRADPTSVMVQDGSQPFDVTVRELPEGPERDEWWARAVAVFPNYARYQEKTDRLIPLFVATRR